MPRMLVVKMGAIGDVAMTVPAARAAFEAGYAIDWVCGPTVVPLLELYPWINRICVDEASVLRGSFAERMRAMATLWRKLAGRQYDVVATLYFDRRYSLLAWPVRAGRRVQIGHAGAQRMVAGRHHTDEYARILLGWPDDETPTHLTPVRPETLPQVSLPAAEGRTRVVLVPAGSRNLMRDDTLRRWPIENYVAVAKELLERGWQVMLAGGPGDEWAVAAFDGLDVTNCIGKFSLAESLALFDSADVTVSHDTGPLHLAGLSRSAVVAIFGPTSPHVFQPQRANSVAMWGGEGFACRPCYDGRNFAPCTHNGCLHQVTPVHVLAQIDRLLRARRSGVDLPAQVWTVSQMETAALVSIRREDARQDSAPAQTVESTTSGQGLRDAGTPALFLDRDGVINHEIGYLYRIEDVRWVDGIFALARTASALGYKLVVVTNQAGIARGLYGEADFHVLMDWMCHEFVRQGVALDGVYFCPYHPEATVEAFRRQHEDRKPGPGMLLRAAADLGLDLTRSVIVGDRCSDIAAARAAGLREAFLLRGTESRPCSESAVEVDSLAEVAGWLERNP